MAEFRKWDRQLRNVFNQAHAFDILDQTLSVDMKQELEELIDQAMSDKQLQMTRALNLVFVNIMLSIWEQIFGNGH